MTQDEELRSESINEPPGSNIKGIVLPEGVGKPVIASIEPTSCMIGDPDFTLDVTGEGFYGGSIIFFAGHDEPTTWNEEESTLSTGVKPSLWSSPTVVQCQVKNGSLISDPVDFTFASAGSTRNADPDDLEDEIAEALDEGDAKTAPKKRKR
jgi:hypothetical protein